MEIRLTEFDDIKSSNTFDIQSVMQEIKQTAPEGVKVNWEYPGYISIVLPDNTEIAFGDSLESDSGYSWNSYDSEGTSEFCNAFNDLKEIDLIVKELWNQARPLLEKVEL
jgi:hypothetical protein